MKVFCLPPRIGALLFDMDSTLYTNGEYAKTQIELPVRELALRLGRTFEETSALIARYRDDWAAAHGGQKISLGAAFAFFGVPIEESVRMREKLYEPERYLSADPELRSTLQGFAALYGLAVVTNNPVSVALRTLACLGIGDLFTVVVGLDTCGVTKPHRAPFLRAAELLKCPPEECVSIGDRYDIDIALPLELGMGGILVDGIGDVRSLNRVLPAGCGNSGG